MPNKQAQPPRWRVSGPYLANLTASAGLFDETRRFLISLGETGDLAKTRQDMVEGGLPQRSRRSRINISKLIYQRLVSWQPPQWVWADLINLAGDNNKAGLASALLLHLARQDKLVYDFIQSFVYKRWQTGETNFSSSDLQRFLDEKQTEHLEVAGWTIATRERLSTTLLATLRDYGLFEGRTLKRIIEPVVPPLAVQHLQHLLLEEGTAEEEELPAHPDWRIWLMDEPRVKTVLKQVVTIGSF